MLLKSSYPNVPTLPAQNIHDRCFNHANLPTEDYTMFIDGLTGRQWTYLEFKRRVSDTIAALGAPESDHGLALDGSAGHIVGVVSPNNVEYIMLAQALFALAVSIAPLSFVATVPELVHMLRRATVTHLFVHPSLLDRALDAARQVGVPESRLYLLEGTSTKQRSLSSLLDATVHAPPVAVRPVTKDTLAYLLFSSGTTGLPKAVAVSHGNVCFQIEQNRIVGRAGQMGAKPTGPVDIPVRLEFLPLHHTYGFHMCFIRAMLAPVKVILLPRWDVNIVLELIPKYRVNDISLIPSFMRTFIEVQSVRMIDLSSLAFVRCGAAHFSPDLQEHIARTVPHAQLSDGFGMSEATSVICLLPIGPALPDHSRVPAGVSGSVGILHPSLAARIVAEDGSLASLDQPGELHVRGGSIAMGYWKDEKATKETFLEGGWLRTGDIFKADEHGNLFFVEREKDTFKVAGSQVAPRELEDLLLAHPKGYIADAAVAGVRRLGSTDECVPRAWVVLSARGRTAGAEKVCQALETWVAERTSRYKHLRGGIEIVDEIPRGATGKALRRVLVERHDGLTSRL